MNLWRNTFGNLLNISDNIITFSNNSKELLVKTYSTLKSENIIVLPHIVDWIEKD